MSRLLLFSAAVVAAVEARLGRDALKGDDISVLLFLAGVEPELEQTEFSSSVQDEDDDVSSRENSTSARGA